MIINQYNEYTTKLCGITALLHGYLFGDKLVNNKISQDQARHTVKNLFRKEIDLGLLDFYNHFQFLRALSDEVSPINSRILDTM